MLTWVTKCYCNCCGHEFVIMGDLATEKELAELYFANQKECPSCGNEISVSILQ